MRRKYFKILINALKNQQTMHIIKIFFELRIKKIESKRKGKKIVCIALVKTFYSRWH